jgi:pimeloyl-ACP methyl ester carboxylesterase
MCSSRRLAAVVIAGLLSGPVGSFAADEPAGQRSSAFSVSIAGSGDRAMVLIPGLMSSGEVWNAVCEHFASRYQLHILTLAGFDGVPPVDGPLLRRVRDDLIAYVRAQRLRKPVLVGHSLGAVVALWAASVAPDAVGDIVAVDGVPFAPALLTPGVSPSDMEPGAEAIRAGYRSMTPEQLEAQTRVALAGIISDPAHVSQALEWARRSSGATAGQAVYDLMTTDLRRAVGSIASDVLIVAAAKAFASDQARLARTMQAYEDQVAIVPQHRVVAAVQALHFVMLDDPSFLLATMDEFLNGGSLR